MDRILEVKTTTFLKSEIRIPDSRKTDPSNGIGANESVHKLSFILNEMNLFINN